MSKRYATYLITSLAGVVLLAADKDPKMVNIQGRVQMLDKNTSSITVEMKSGIRRKVEYTNDTKFLYGHSRDSQPGSLDQVKATNYISCVGTFDNSTTLKAKQCVYRDTK